MKQGRRVLYHREPSVAAVTRIYVIVGMCVILTRPVTRRASAYHHVGRCDLTHPQP